MESPPNINKCATLSAPGNRGGGFSPNGFGASVSHKIARMVRMLRTQAGNLDKALTVKAAKFSESAIKKINEAGGKVEVL